MSRGVRGLTAVLLLAALAGLVLWMLGTRDDEGAAVARGEAAAASQAPEFAASPTLPAPDTAATAAALTAGGESAKPPTATSAPADFTGRVVDAQGRPIVGAAVLHWPSFGVRSKRHIGRPGFDGGVDPAVLTQTRTDADGRFTLAVDDEPPGPDAMQGLGGSWSPEDALAVVLPSIVVMHPDFEITAFPCRGWAGGPFAAGELVVLPGASVTGRVVDEEHRPLAGVSVAPPPFTQREDHRRRIEWDSMSKLLGVVTGDDGRFRIDGLWAGVTSFSISLAGRDGQAIAWTLQAGDTKDFGDIVLASGAVLDGRVQDPQGHPLAGVRVVARPDSIHESRTGADEAAAEFSVHFMMDGLIVDAEAQTDAAGNFRITGLPATRIPSGPPGSGSTYRVMAGADAWEPVLVRNVVPGGEPLSLTLQPAGRLVLQILEPDGKTPVSGVRVVVHRLLVFEQGSEPLDLKLLSEPDALQQAGLAPPFAGVFLVQGAGAGRNEATLFAPGHARQGFVLPGVAPGESKSVTLTLPRESRLAGRVLDPEHRPIAAALVVLQPPKTLRVAQDERHAQTDADGRFAFDTMQRGDWTVRASAPAFVEGETPLITVKKETAVEGVELVLQRAGAVEGVVLVRGAPAAGLMLRATPPPTETAPPEPQTGRFGEPPASESAKHSALSDAAGHFRIDSLAAGAWILSGPPGTSQPVQIVAGQTTQVSIAAHAPPRLHGQVLDANGPVAGADITIDIMWREPDAFMHELSTSTDRDGRYEAVLEKIGRYRVQAGDHGANTPAVALNVAWDDEPTVDLRFASGVLRGLVVDATSGAPVADAQLWLAAPGTSYGAWRGYAHTGTDGRFEFRRVPDGDYDLTARHNDYSASGDVPVHVPQDPSAPELRIALRSAGVVRGHVTGPVGEGLLLRCVPLAAQDDEKRAEVGADGQFERRQLAPGSWRCELFRRTRDTSGVVDGPVLVSQNVQVAAGETASLELTLP